VRPLIGHVRLMQPVAHTTSRDFLAASTGALEVLMKYLRRIKNARLQPSNSGECKSCTSRSSLYQSKFSIALPRIPRAIKDGRTLRFSK